MNIIQNELHNDLISYSNSAGSSKDYNKIIQKLLNGDYILYLPTQNEGEIDNKWKTLDKGSKLNLKSVFEVDGQNVLAAFSSENRLSEWSQNSSKYTVVNSKDIVSLCEANNINRIVIDSDQPTMFVLENGHNEVSTQEINQPTEVSIRAITKEIDSLFIDKLIQQSNDISPIEEIYQFEMLRNEEEILMLGFNLNIYNDSSYKACIEAVKNSISAETFHLPLEVFFLEDTNWLKAVENLPLGLIWKR